jgi:hypothetical protein
MMRGRQGQGKLFSVSVAATRAREVSIGDNDDEKDSLTHFLFFVLHRFMVLCSGKKGNDDGKGKSMKGKCVFGVQGDDMDDDGKGKGGSCKGDDNGKGKGESVKGDDDDKANKGPH